MDPGDEDDAVMVADDEIAVSDYDSPAISLGSELGHQCPSKCIQWGAAGGEDWKTEFDDLAGVTYIAIHDHAPNTTSNSRAREQLSPSGRIAVAVNGEDRDVSTREPLQNLHLAGIGLFGDLVRRFDDDRKGAPHEARFRKQGPDRRMEDLIAQSEAVESVRGDRRVTPFEPV